ncbi:hypothetical protein [Phenylobacterium sp.]|uniref:hypothetical protein n=1 Tax=Phenylobacterium sp. TaxID=1871053 RepID=UPI002CAE38F1|nr:hypothetical protein [Phenylobacterium sp.]HVI31353.1 hypothetical protein [Phenylobacterium sp.]
MADPHPLRLSRGRLLLSTAGAAAVALLVLFAAVIPAEFGRDPTGLGKATGLSKLWSPPQVALDPNTSAGPLAREYPTGFRTDVVEIPLRAVSGDPRDFQLEYKVRMKKGATLVYEWRVEGARNAADLYYDFHGHTLAAAPGETMTVATYRQATGERQAGALTAGFDGIHGWFFQNSGFGPVVVRLKLAGFYDLIPAGQAGNEAGIVANVPAAKARPAG